MGEGERLVRLVNDRGFIGRDLSVFEEVLSGDFVEHDIAFEGMGEGRDFMRNSAEQIMAAFSDMEFIVDEYHEFGDVVVENWVIDITHDTAPFMGVEPAGKRIRTRGIDMFRFCEGKLTEHWGVVDTLGIARQLGLSLVKEPEPVA
jgi:predicted ester cyclase